MYIHLSQYLFKVGSLLEASDFHRIIDNAKLNKLGGQPNTRPISSTRTCKTRHRLVACNYQAGWALLVCTLSDWTLSGWALLPPVVKSFNITCACSMTCIFLLILICGYVWLVICGM